MCPGGKMHAPFIGGVAIVKANPQDKAKYALLVAVFGEKK